MLHINGKFTIGKLKSPIVSYTFRSQSTWSITCNKNWRKWQYLLQQTKSIIVLIEWLLFNLMWALFLLCSRRKNKFPNYKSDGTTNITFWWQGNRECRLVRVPKIQWYQYVWTLKSDLYQGRQSVAKLHWYLAVCMDT